MQMRLIVTGLVLTSAGLHGGASLAQDAEAQARIERAASNPLRMIIEAGKLKPRGKAADPEPAAKPAPAEKVAARTTPTKPAEAPRDAAPSAVEPRVEAVGTRTAVAAARPMAAQPPVAAPADDSPSVATATDGPSAAAADAPLAAPPAAERSADPSAPAATPPAEPAAEPKAPETAPAPAQALTADDQFGVAPPVDAATVRAMAKLAAAQLAATVPAPAVPPAVGTELQMASFVEPVVPDRLRRKLQATGTVIVGFTVNADGSVGNAAVQSSTERGLEVPALDAVRQWRYKPIATAQSHTVELVFKLRE